MASFDVLILGAGIVGCACASRLSALGMHVGIVEPGCVGAGATAAGMGHVVVMDDSPAQLALTHYARSLWQDLIPELPTSVEYEPRGTLWVAANEQEMAEVHAKSHVYGGLGISWEVLDEAALAAAEPNLRRGLSGALLVPEDAVLYPPAAAAFFLKQALDRKAVLLQGQAAVRVGRGSVDLADGSIHTAGQIVVATGTDLRLIPSLSIQKRKGHLLITDRYPGFLHHQLVELGYLTSAHTLASASVAFNVQPRRTGQLLIGSSRQYGAEDPGIDHAILTRMLERACEYMPGLRSLSSVRAWTGFRAATPDKLPLIGPTEDPTVWLALGFEGLGITNAPGTAHLLADLMLGLAPAIDPTPYSPERLLRASLATESAHA